MTYQSVPGVLIWTTVYDFVAWLTSAGSQLQNKSFSFGAVVSTTEQDRLNYIQVAQRNILNSMHSLPCISSTRHVSDLSVILTGFMTIASSLSSSLSFAVSSSVSFSIGHCLSLDRSQAGSYELKALDTAALVLNHRTPCAPCRQQYKLLLTYWVRLR